MPTPPIAPKRAHSLTAHDHTRTDEYYWMRDRENPEVISYLEAENAYTKAELKHTEPLQAELFEEIKARFVPDDASVPYRMRDYYYYSRYEAGKEYPFFCRKKGSLDAPEEIMLNVNELAEGHAYYQVAGLKISQNQQLLAFGVDTVGRRIYTIQVKNLESGEMLPTSLEGATGNLTWAEDNETIFYSQQDPETLRSHRIYRHLLGSDPATDVLIYEESDETFRCYVEKTKSREFLCISSHSTVSTEYRVLEADQPMGEFRVLQARERDHEYFADHFDGHWYYVSNWEAQNFRLLRSDLTQTNKESWEEVIPHRPEVLLENMEIFRHFLVLEERAMGLTQIQVIPWGQQEQAYYLTYDDPVYLAGIGANPEMDSQLLRFSYQSMTTPSSTLEINMLSKEQHLLKEQPILGGFDKNNYRSERLFATATDGTDIPMSLVYRTDLRKGGPQPLLLYAYGSYGHSMDPYFSPARLSLLDRGVVFVIAHVRGGSEMGRHWYESGKLRCKQNTFSDFIACAEGLIEQGYTDKDHLFCQGGSAGGLLVGAVINQRPDLFHGAIAAVPFVDVVTTMLDEDIPLTTGEYDEWGDPNQPEFYHYMLSYSPYDNVKAQAYPNLLITSGLHDSQVQYWEPTKWAARLRAHKADQNQLLLHTNMEAGHSGTTGRFEPYKEVAMEYAFLLNLSPDFSPDPQN